MVAVVVINMDRDAARMEHMRGQLDAAGLRYQRYAALDGHALPDHIKPYFAGAPDLSRGEIGCYASHLDILLKMVAGEIASPALVLEDDVALCEGFASFIDALLLQLPPNWDFVRLSNPPNRAYMPVADIDPARVLCRYALIPPSTGASLISLDGARKFSVAGPRAWPIDQDLRRAEDWGLETFGVAPAPIDADVLETSTIATLSPFDAARLKARERRMRAHQAKNLWVRQGQAIRHFGLVNWLTSLWLNLAVRQLPRAGREAYLAGAARRFAAGAGARQPQVAISGDAH